MGRGSTWIFNASSSIKPRYPSWWFQPLCKILVKMGIFPYRGENKTCLKPPPSISCHMMISPTISSRKLPWDLKTQRPKTHRSSSYQDAMAHTQLRQGVWVTCSRRCPVTAAQFLPNMAKIELLGIILGSSVASIGRIHLNILTNKVHLCKLTLDNPPCWEYLPGITGIFQCCMLC